MQDHQIYFSQPEITRFILASHAESLFCLCKFIEHYFIDKPTACIAMSSLRKMCSLQYLPEVENRGSVRLFHGKSRI